MAPRGNRTFSLSQTEKTHLEENEIMDIRNRNEPVRDGRLVESINMLSGEMNARMSREMETMMDFMQAKISRAINSAISERIIPQMQNII